MRNISVVILLSVLTLNSCQNSPGEVVDEALLEKARQISRDFLILDSHIDWPERFGYNPEDISNETESGDFDFVRARRGGLDAAFSVIYISPEYGVDTGRIMVDSFIDDITYYASTYPDKFALAANPSEIEDNFSNNLFSIPLCLENGTPIGDDLQYLSYLKEKGIAYITLNHSKANQISDSSYDTTRLWNGLSPFGIEVVQEMNRLGIMIDISHSTDSAVFQTLQYSSAPVVATHSSCRHFTPGFERNLSDTLIQAIAQKDGVVMIAFGSGFIDSVCMVNINYLYHWFDSTGVSMRSEEGRNFIRQYGQDHQLLADSSQVVDHIEHVVRIAGIDHVGIGSDYDGIGPSQPVGLPDVSSYPVIVQELLKRGFSEEDIGKILSGNFLRVWNAVLQAAESLK